MKQVSPQLRELASRLIAYETGEDGHGAFKTARAIQVSEKLRPQLATIMGNRGFQALVSRSLALAKTTAPGLNGVQVNPVGTVEGAEALHKQLAPSEFSECSIVLLAQLLGLMVAFIGTELTLWLVREAWPGAPLHDEDISQ
jgi:hypothetical protein